MCVCLYIYIEKGRACVLSSCKLGAHTFHRSIPKHSKGVFSSMCCYTRPFMSFPSPACPYVRCLSPAAQILDRACGACCGAHFWSVPAALLLFGQVPSLILVTRASSSSQNMECKLVLPPVSLSLSPFSPVPVCIHPCLPCVCVCLRVCVCVCVCDEDEEVFVHLSPIGTNSKNSKKNLLFVDFGVF